MTPKKNPPPNSFLCIKRKMIVTIMKPVAEFEHLNVSHHCWFSGFPTFFVRTTIWISSFLWQSPKKGQNWIHTLRKHNIVQHFYYTVFRKSHVVWLSSESELFAKNWNNCTTLQVNFAQKQYCTNFCRFVDYVMLYQISVLTQQRPERVSCDLINSLWGHLPPKGRLENKEFGDK